MDSTPSDRYFGAATQTLAVIARIHGCCRTDAVAIADGA
jgi:hypothetical protein